MEFTRIFNGLANTCLNGTEENELKNEFLRAMKPKSEDFCEKDFQSQWEEGKVCEDPKKECSHRGVSISLLTGTNEEDIIKVYKRTLAFSPKLNRGIAKIRFNEICGRLKHVPSPFNNYHYVFFKCDGFAIEKITLISIIR